MGVRAFDRHGVASTKTALSLGDSAEPVLSTQTLHS